MDNKDDMFGYVIYNRTYFNYEGYTEYKKNVKYRRIPFIW